jgi:hypothetical protein
VDHVLHLYGVLEVGPARVATGPEGHLFILNHERSCRELLKITDVIVVKVGEDHVGDPSAIHADLTETSRGTAKIVSSPLGRYLGCEPRIDDYRGLV